MTIKGAFNAPQPAPGSSRDTGMGPCSRKCCWSPFGHSTARDGVPSWHRDACKCHTKEQER